MAGLVMAGQLVGPCGGAPFGGGSRAAASEPPESPVVAGLARLDSLLAAGDAAAAVRWAAGAPDFGEDPVFGWQWHQRWGVALLRAGDPAAALPHLEQAARGAPLKPENHRNLAAALRKLGRKGRAVGEYQQAVELAPDDATLHLEYGQALSDLGMERAALGELQAADHLSGGSLPATRALAELHVAAKRFGEARPYLERLYASGPDLWVRKALALARLRAGATDSAAAPLTSLPAAARDAESWRLLAEIDRAAGRAERWPPLMAQVPPGADLPPEARESAAFWGVVAEALQKDDDPEMALAAIDLALALAPADTVLLNHRIILLKTLGRESEARADDNRLQKQRGGGRP